MHLQNLCAKIHCSSAQHSSCHPMFSPEESQYPHRTPGITYLDSAGRSVLPRSVEVVGINAIQEKSQPWNGVGSDDDIQKVRESFGALIGATSSSIALTPSTGFAMTLVAKNVVRSGRLAQGRTVIILDKEMGSAVYPWQEACKETGATFVVVSDPLLMGNSHSWTEEILNSIDENVAVVALPAVHWCNGALIDLVAVSAKLAAFPKEKRPLLVVDGTQSLGALPFSLADIHADVVACSVHKWLNCPYGMSLLYIHPDHHSWEPLDHHERGREGSNQSGWDETIFMHRETGFYPEALFPDARRFDAGGKANPVTVPMVRAGLHTVLTSTPSAVQAHCAVLTDALAAQLQSIFGEQIVIRSKAHRSAHILGLRFDRGTMHGLYNKTSLMQLHAELKRENVFVSVRGEWLRVSVYLHNSLADINRFVALFVQITQKLNITSLGENGSIAHPNGKSKGKRVLLTGSAGWLAQYVLHSLLPHTVFPGESGASIIKPTCVYEIYASYSSAVPHWVPAQHRVHLDLSDVASIRSVITTLKPDIIIHTAALSSPVVCHKDVQRAYAINCPTALIDAVQEYIPDACFVFTSTDMVYDGEHAPYQVSSEASSEPQPVNVYGATKLAFEREVLRLKHGAVLRLSNMIGAPYKYNPAGAKFLEWVYGAFSRQEFIGLKQQEIRSFVYVQDVVDVILKLVHVYCSKSDEDGSCNVHGVYNVGGPVPMSRLNVARSLCRVLGSEIIVSTGPPEATVLAKKAPDSRAAWNVYVMDSPENNSIAKSDAHTSVSSASSNTTTTVVYSTGTNPVPVAVRGELRSPRDISMDSTATQQALNLVFTPIEAILCDSLHVN